ncbi:hypothetical protein CR513_14373, partial [Mucuna pruriens]
MFFTYKDESFKVFYIFCKRIKMKKNLKIKTFNNTIKNKEFIMIFHIQELLNMMVLCKEK